MGKVTVTEHVLLAGAAWLVPSPTLIVIVADPAAFPVTVMIFPDTLTVATLGALETAEITPFPARVAVIVPDKAEAFKVREGDRSRRRSSRRLRSGFRPCIHGREQRLSGS